MNYVIAAIILKTSPMPILDEVSNHPTPEAAYARIAELIELGDLPAPTEDMYYTVQPREDRLPTLKDVPLLLNEESSVLDETVSVQAVGITVGPGREKRPANHDTCTYFNRLCDGCDQCSHLDTSDANDLPPWV